MQESIQLVIDSAPFLLKGAVFTLQLSIGGMFFGLVLGFILALMRMSPVWPIKWLARMYISIFRGTPLRSLKLLKVIRRLLPPPLSSRAISCVLV